MNKNRVKCPHCVVSERFGQFSISERIVIISYRVYLARVRVVSRVLSGALAILCAALLTFSYLLTTTKSIFF